MDCLKTGIILSVGQVWVGWKCGLRHLLNLDTHKIGATITFTLFCVSYNTILLQTRLYLNVFYLDPIFQPFKTWPYLSVFSHFLSLSFFAYPIFCTVRIRLYAYYKGNPETLSLLSWMTKICLECVIYCCLLISLEYK